MVHPMNHIWRVNNKCTSRTATIDIQPNMKQNSVHMPTFHDMKHHETTKQFGTNMKRFGTNMKQRICEHETSESIH